jgi:hypothetical protein
MKTVVIGLLGFGLLFSLIGTGWWIFMQKRKPSKQPCPPSAPVGWTNVSIRPHGEKGKGIR